MQYQPLQAQSLNHIPAMNSREGMGWSCIFIIGHRVVWFQLILHRHDVIPRGNDHECNSEPIPDIHVFIRKIKGCKDFRFGFGLGRVMSNENDLGLSNDQTIEKWRIMRCRRWRRVRRSIRWAFWVGDR